MAIRRACRQLLALVLSMRPCAGIPMPTFDEQGLPAGQTGRRFPGRKNRHNMVFEQ